MEERDCTNCSHYKTVYAPYLHKYIKSCEVWQCEFERKENENISDNVRNENRAEQSRKAAIQGLGEQPYAWTDSDFEIQQIQDWKTTKEMLENLPSVLPKTTKNDLGVDVHDNNVGNIDCISRADAIGSIAVECSAEKLDIDYAKFLMLRRAIKALPSVTPQEPKTGHWIEHEWKEMREKGYYRCSVCNYAYQRYTKGIRKSDVPYIDGQEYILWNCDNYCPNCGCRMVEPQESEQ